MHRTRLVCTFVAAAAIAIATPAHAQLTSELFVSGLSAPVAFVQDPSQPGVQLVAEQGGRIRAIQNGTIVATDFLDLTAETEALGEQGLLGLAFAPDYATSGRFYVNFTNLSGHTVIARFLRSSADPLRADPASRFDLVWPDGRAYIEQPFGNHNGGDLAFGPDGYLYVPLGDGGGGNDPQHRAQDPQTLLGKMVRIDVGVALTHPTGYVVPDSNPFVGTPGVLAEIWAFGYRNPWRFTFDDPTRGGTGAMLVADVGQSTREEINYEPAGAGGRNYGWRNREGSVANVVTLPPFSEPLIDPIYEYGRTEGQVVAGGHVYRGSALGAAYQGRYFFADVNAGRVWSIGLTVDPLTGEGAAGTLLEHTAELGRGAVVVASFGVDGTGELYTVGYGTGEVHRILLDPPPSTEPPPTSEPPSSCTSVKPAPDWVCVNGGWLPPGLAPPGGVTPPPTPPPTTPPPSSDSCTSVKPAADWVCVNGGWLPPGLAPPVVPPPTTPPPTSPPPTTPPPTTPPAGCTSVQPAPDWVCVNGGWLPPGLVPPGSVTPPPTTPPPTTPPPTTPPAGCTTPQPASDWVCVNGGWLPPGLVPPGSVTPPPTTPPPTPPPADCTTPDPFIGIPGLAGICVNGGWLPTELLQTTATVQFIALEGGFWALRLDDGRLFALVDPLPAPFQVAGLRVTITAKVRPDLVSPAGSLIELLQIQ